MSYTAAGSTEDAAHQPKDRGTKMVGQFMYRDDFSTMEFAMQLEFVHHMQPTPSSPKETFLTSRGATHEVLLQVLQQKTVKAWRRLIKDGASLFGGRHTSQDTNWKFLPDMMRH